MPEAPARRGATSIELLVTVSADGAVGDIEVVGSAGPELDEAAMSAVRQWRFEPARRGEQAVASRIRVSVPLQSAQPAALAKQTSDPPAISSTSESPVAAPVEVVVRGRRQLRTDERSAGDFNVGRDVIAAAPRKEGTEVLRSAPGVYVGRGEGAAVAHNYMLRGFDAEHGQDIEFRVGGLPINLPSHLHGQGYADLGFLIGDAIQELRISEGVHDPRQGDFAVAGSIDLTLGVDSRDRGVLVRSSYGAFDTYRQLVLWAPPDAPDGTFGAAQYESTAGFGQNRAGQAGSAIFQHRSGDGGLSYRTIGILHTARSSSAGVVRADDVDAGRVCFYCVYSHATARAQNALASRFLLGLFADHQNDDGANGQLGAWFGYDDFRIQENFTGFVQTSRVLERTAGRGDLTEQQNRTLSFGLTGRYRTAPLRAAPGIHGTLEVGSDGRFDVIDQSQNLLDASVRNQTWDNRVDASVRGVDLGFWGDFDWVLTRHLQARAGLRADVLSYNVEDRLGNFAPLTRSQDSFIRGFRRSALGLAWGPRASVQVLPLPWLSVLAAYGEGYRSPQARLLEDGEKAPFSRVHSADVGVRLDLGDPLRLTLGGYWTQLSDDVAFDATEGSLLRIGPTARQGAVLHGITRPVDWIVASASVTVVRATLLEPPPPSAAEPQPPLTEGQRLPFVPPVVARADVGARPVVVESLAGKPFGLRAGLGFSYLSPRPLPYGDFADPVALLDGSAGASWGPLELGFELFNALHTQYAAVEHSFPSDWDPDDGVRPRTPARHFAAGAPRSWLLSLGVTL